MEREAIGDDVGWVGRAVWGTLLLELKRTRVEREAQEVGAYWVVWWRRRRRR